MSSTFALASPMSIIEDGLRNAGILADGDVPSSEQIASSMRSLQRMINLWQTSGLKLWLQMDASIPLVAGKGGQGNPYLLGPGGDLDMTKPLRIQQGYYLDANNIRRPIYPLSWDEWMRLSQTNQLGQVTQYFVNKQQTNLEVNFWLVPDENAATGTAHLLLQQQVVIPTSLTETMNFPPEWGIALVWGLADEVCTGQPQAIMDRCQQRAMMYKEQLEAWDVEDAQTSFAPDQRMGAYSTGNFV